MNLDLKGKHALVCGSTQGIGKASAIELALLGARVTLMARNGEKLREICKQLPSSGQQHDYIVADFNATDNVRESISDYVSNHKIHVLVNNTGGPPGGQAIDARLEEFTSAFAAHLLCNQILVQAVTPAMKEEKYGRIINIISTSVKMPIKGLGVSNTIRAAVANWAKTLSIELGPFGITVNNVLPGATMTGRLASITKAKAEKLDVTEEKILKEMVEEIPARRICAPEEVAAAVAFLATPAAGYINGINVPVDGGRTGTL